MSGVNKAILLGNLGKDPEIRRLDDGRAVANFSIATSETYKNKAGERVTNTEWHNVVLWSPLAEIAEKANGTYVDGKNTKSVTETVSDILNKMDKKEFEAKEFAEYEDQFQWFLGLGLFFLILDILFLERKTAWLKRLNLFNENL